jgi:hypothetical protein
MVGRAGGYDRGLGLERRFEHAVQLDRDRLEERVCEHRAVLSGAVHVLR